MEIKGKLLTVLPSVTGQGAKGNWTKQEFVIETMDQYPKKIAFEVWGDDCRTLDDYKPGFVLSVMFNVESREHDGRWYTTARAWKTTPIGK